MGTLNAFMDFVKDMDLPEGDPADWKNKNDGNDHRD